MVLSKVLQKQSNLDFSYSFERFLYQQFKSVAEVPKNIRETSNHAE